MSVSQWQFFELDSSQLNLLLPIAMQCPVVGGPAVYQARSLIANNATINYNDDLACSQQNISFRTQPTQPITKLNAMADLTILPNPSNGNFIISTIANSSLTIYNTIGLVVLDEQLKSERQKINLTSLPDGCYYAKITNPNGDTAQKTIIIAK